MAETDAPQRKEINAEPTKAFFVDMLTRDIPLEQAVLDLVDNCVDGAKRIAAGRESGATRPYDGCKVEIVLNSHQFSIYDNCGGFDVETAQEYAFRFGRPAAATRTAHSIGQFGVGMKRALFKFGRHFRVESSTSAETWAVDVDVEQWEAETGGWSFPWAEVQSDKIGQDKPGTDILVTKLRREVAAKFGTTYFVNSIIGLIKSKHRQFISDGLDIKVNDTRIDATNIYLLVGDGFTPGTDILEFSEDGAATVTAKIIVGLGKSSPKEAGWNVICNGRVVLEADRRPQTGWGLLEENAEKMIIPSFHNQFARFRGIVSFDSDDSSRIPWNTTKTDVDVDSNVWRSTFQRMLEMMRPVIDFLNELDADIDENTKEKSPLLEFVTKAAPQGPETFQKKADFTAPNRSSVARGPKLVKIQFSRTVDDVEFLQDALGVTSAKAVGETCFDMVLTRQRD